MAGALTDRPPQNQDPTRGRANPTVCRATYGGRGGTQTAARPGSKAGPSHPRRRRAGPAARRTWPATSPPASQGRAGRYHPGRCRAAGGICARAARPARGRPDARFRRRDRRPAGTGNAAPRRQVELTHPPPLGGADKPPSPPTARVADCGEGNFVIDVAPLAGPFVDDGAAHPDPTVRAVTGRHLEGDGESVVVVGPELHLAVSVDVIPDGAGPDQGPDVERERGFDQSATAGSHGPVLPNRSDSLNHSECCTRNGALGTYEGVSGKYALPPQGWVRLDRLSC